MARPKLILLLIVIASFMIGAAPSRITMRDCVDPDCITTFPAAGSSTDWANNAMMQAIQGYSEDYAKWLDGAINVQEAPYNAKGDGVTNDTAAIQAASNAGRIIDFGDSSNVYLISSVLVLKDNLTWTGKATIKQANNTNLTRMVRGQTSGNTYRNVVIKGITFDYNKANNTTYSDDVNNGRILDLDGTYNPWLEDVRLINGPSIGALYGNYNEVKRGAVFKNIYCESMYSCLWITGINTSGWDVDGVFSKDTALTLTIEDGASAGQASHIKAENPRLADFAVLVQTLGTPEQKDITISDVLVTGAISGGVAYTRANGGCLKVVNTKGITTSNVKCIALTQGIVGSTSGAGVLDDWTITDPVLYDSTDGTADGSQSIFITSGKRIAINNPKITLSATVGITLNSVTEAEINGGTILNSGTDSNSPAVQSANSSGVIVKGLRTFDDRGTKKQTYGITTTGTSDYFTIAGNDFRGNLSGETSLVGSNNLVYGNKGSSNVFTLSIPIDSTVSQGTAPMIVASSTKVNTFNADLLDGQDWFSPSAIGSTTPQDGTFTNLSVTTSVLPNSGGFKHKSVTTGSIAGGASAAVTLTWGTAFADASYTPQCSLVEATTTTSTIRIHHIESFTASAVVVRIVNDDATVAKTGTLHCSGLHS